MTRNTQGSRSGLSWDLLKLLNPSGQLLSLAEQHSASVVGELLFVTTVHTLGNMKFVLMILVMEYWVCGSMSLSSGYALSESCVLVPVRPTSIMICHSASQKTSGTSLRIWERFWKVTAWWPPGTMLHLKRISLWRHCVLSLSNLTKFPSSKRQSNKITTSRSLIY